ncbi:MAG TPA: hypothetical protein VEK33_03685 [Terriglobales bacterium]|nr:hypothetical protein [Terriglobales bacterium]
MKSLVEHIRVTGREMLPIETANQIDFLPLGQREPLLWEKFDLASAKFAELIRHLAESQVYLDPTLTVDESDFVLGAEEQRKNANNSALPLEWVKFAESQQSPLFEVPAALKETARKGFKKRKEFVAMLRNRRKTDGSCCFQLRAWLKAIIPPVQKDSGGLPSKPAIVHAGFYFLGLTHRAGPQSIGAVLVSIAADRGYGQSVGEVGGHFCTR